MKVKKESIKDSKIISIIRRLGPLLALVILVVILTFTTEGRFMTVANVMNIMRQTPIIALMAVGMLCVILLGGIDLSAGSVLALSICISGAVMLNFNIQNSFILFVVCLATGTLVGATNGILLTKLKLPHPFIATLGMKNIARGLALLVTGATAIAGFPRGMTFIGTANVGRIPFSFILTIMLYICMHIFLTYSALGRKMYSFGGNREAARLAGINTDRVQIFGFAASGFFCAVAGIVFIGRLNSAVPLASLEGDLDAIAACIIGGASFSGGKGTVWGTLIGAMIIAVIRNGLDLMGVSSDLQMVVIGAVIIIAVYIDVLRKQMDARSRRLAIAKSVES